ncbi:MAG TPA: dihydroorotate dehydrogenase [Gemmatimonadales bacterium]|nr:dihydroorotate dehydrogenase [Gemmatimonadales bacterium]
MSAGASTAIEVLGCRFRNPVLLAAGTAGFGRELAGIVDLSRLGGLVTKAVSLEPRRGNPAPRVAEFTGGMMNSVGLANPGLAEVRSSALPWLAREWPGLPVIVNIVGDTEEDYAGVVAGLEESPGITALELNLSCPNSHAGGLEFGADARSVAAVVGACRARTRRPILAKLSPALPDIPAMAAAAIDAGADGVSLVNTLPGYLFGATGASTRLGQGNGGVSGPALLPIGVLAIRKVRQRLPAAVLVGVGGIRSAADARQYLRAGADLVAVGTAALADPRIPERIARELEQSDG